MKPEFSVVIASVNGLPTIVESLASLERCRRSFHVEIIVVDVTGEETTSRIESDFPDVILIKLETRPGIPEMRAMGINRATGKFLVITEDHCIAPENWFDEFRQLHAKGFDVVGGAVENGCTERIIDWAAHFCEYSAFLPPIETGETDVVAGNNVSYVRKELRKVKETTLRGYWEYFIQSELSKKGCKFFVSNTIIVLHKKEFGFSEFMLQRFHYSRSFSAMRSKKSSAIRKIMIFGYIPLSPIHLTLRIFKNVFQKKRNRRELFISVPFLVLFMCSYAAGEMIGHIFGGGSSLAKVE